MKKYSMYIGIFIVLVLYTCTFVSVVKANRKSTCTELLAITATHQSNFHVAIDHLPDGIVNNFNELAENYFTAKHKYEEQCS